MEILLADGRMNSESNLSFALSLAAFKGHDSLVELMLADTRICSDLILYPAVHDARLAGHQSIVDMLLADPRASIFPTECEGNKLH
jgi:hypothetical protein